MEKRWITGEGILIRWDAMDFELMQAFDAGLCPYCQDTGRQLSRIGPKQSKAHIQQPTEKELQDAEQQRKKRAEEAKKRTEEAKKRGLITGSGAPGSTTRPWMQKDIFRELRNSYFKMSEVQEYEEKHGMRPPDLSSNEEPATEDTFYIDESINYSVKPKHIQAELAAIWMEKGKTRREVAQILYKQEFEAGHTKIDALLKRVDRLPMPKK